MATLGNEYKNESPRILAWTKHLVAKGCCPVTARNKAYRKVQETAKWPKP